MITVFSGGCDKQVKMWPLLSGGQPVTVAMHDAPLIEFAWVPEMNLLVTGSWDKTLKYWDTRQSNPVHTQQLPDCCYALTVRHPLMVVGTAYRNLIVFNLQNLQVGSIEERVGVHHLDDSKQSKNFTFKCHIDNNDIYSVNSLNFHPIHHTFATVGSDGLFNFWDKDMLPSYLCCSYSEFFPYITFLSSLLYSFLFFLSVLSLFFFCSISLFFLYSFSVVSLYSFSILVSHLLTCKLN